MKQRLEQFLSAENLTRAQFADSIGVARAGISHIMAGRNNPSYEFIVNTMKAYPDLNIEWLLQGTGKMYKNTLFADTPLPEGKDDDASKESETISTETTASNNNTQNIVNKRIDFRNDAVAKEIVPKSSSRVSKIVLFYSDGTYEEFC